MLELDFREAGQCEIAFIGLVPELAGQGHGRWLLAEALRLAWRDGVSRVHVHTCSLDHPAALAAYRRAGFTAFKRAIERFPDPRLTRHPADRLRPSGAAGRHLDRRALAAQLNIDPRHHHHQDDRDRGADDLDEERDKQRPDGQRLDPAEDDLGQDPANCGHRGQRPPARR